MTRNYPQKSKLREGKQKTALHAENHSCRFSFLHPFVGAGGEVLGSLCCHASVRSGLTLVRCDCHRLGKMSRCRVPGANTPGWAPDAFKHISLFFLFLERLPRRQQSAKKKQRQSVIAAGCLPLASALKPGVRHVQSGKV